MKGQNTCQWLVIGSTELCGKSCLGYYCKIHFARLRRGSGIQPCMECGKGVKSRFRLCLDCGYRTTRMRAWQGIIGLLWSSLNVWRPSTFSFRGFLLVTYIRLELWHHKAEIRAWQRSHSAWSLNVWPLSNYFHLEVFLSVAYTRRHYGRPDRRNSCRTPRPSPRGSTIYRPRWPGPSPIESSGRPVGRDS